MLINILRIIQVSFAGFCIIWLLPGSSRILFLSTLFTNDTSYFFFLKLLLLFSNYSDINVILSILEFQYELFFKWQMVSEYKLFKMCFLDFSKELDNHLQFFSEYIFSLIFFILLKLMTISILLGQTNRLLIYSSYNVIVHIHTYTLIHITSFCLHNFFKTIK